MTTTLSTDVAPQAAAPQNSAAEKAAAPLSPLAAVNGLADLVVEFLRPIAVPVLRIALGVVYVWFGILKIAGVSPIDQLVASMVPFLPAEVAVAGMGWVEVALGAGLIAGFGVRWIAAAQVLHLLGTFAVFVFQPEAAYVGNPFVVTLEGEFIAKNLVLVAALLVVASHPRKRSS
jgi:putative oxidoreductase